MSLLSFLAMADMLLLDAPTANLVIAHALNALDLYQQPAQEGKAIGLVIHDINAAARCTIYEVDDDTHL
jgi:ABC-type cobalamin/Fe3+-siderophores transport system ATPase subunit